MAKANCCVCGASEATLCAVCKSAAYCSDKCKQSDARTHGLLCQEFASFIRTSSRPCPSAIVALYFPILTYGQNGLNAPKIVWIDPKHHMQIAEQKDDGTLEYTDALEYDALEASCMLPRNISRPVAATEQIIETKLHLMQPVIEEPVALNMRAAWNFDGSRANITIVETTLGELHHGWKGPLLVYSTSHKDITLSSFHSFIEFCKVFKIAKKGLFDFLRTNNLIELEFTNPAFFHSVLLRHSDKIFEGVEITCQGDKKFLGTEQFVAVDVSNSHPIFDDINMDHGYIVGQGATEVSKMIGLPLLIRRILPDRRWNHGNQQGPANYVNTIAKHFNLTLDVGSAKWRFRDQGGPCGEIYGRVLVVRKDQLGVTVHQVEALAAFFEKVYDTFFEARSTTLKYAKRGKLLAARTKLMAEHISRSKFEKFFEDFKKEKINKGDISWVNEKSPYEVTAEIESAEAESSEVKSAQVESSEVESDDEESDGGTIGEVMEALKL